MIARNIENEILKSLKQFPVVGIIGSRQVGKTTLAKKIQVIFKNSLYLDLELPSDVKKLAEPELYLIQHQDKLIIIDEIQLKPTLFPLIRALVDKHRRPGRFLILGSSTSKMINKTSESLAGRIIFHELEPFDISEIEKTDKNIRNLWIRGGYPLSYLSKNDETSLKWRNAFIRTYLERDIPNMGINIPANQIRRFWMMLAHSQGQLWNSSSLARSMGVTPPTIKHYLDILESGFMIRQLIPYSANIKKRLIKSPKIYFRDCGLLHTLLDISSYENIFSHPIAGHSWEGYIIQQIISIFKSKYKYYFFRTNAGAEIDLILKRAGKLIAVEIKLSLSPGLSKGFWIAYHDLQCAKGYVIYPGDQTYPISKDITALPVSKLDNI